METCEDTMFRPCWTGKECDKVLTVDLREGAVQWFRRRWPVVRHDAFNAERHRILLLVLLVRRLGELEPLPPPQEGSVLEHVECGGMEGPVGTLPRPVRPPRDLHEAVVEGEVVPEGILPALGVPPVVGESVADEPVDVG